MRIYGADFSGAKGPEIALVVGNLEDDTLNIETIRHCDDRLDLYRHIAETSTEEQLCGLDFPFRLPQAALEKLEVVELHELAFKHTRTEFASLLTSRLGKHEGRCTGATIHCRQTDVECNAYSGVKRINPSLMQMLYSGSKLLSYLHDLGIESYPLHEPSNRQLCEVYPSHSWAKVGLPRSTNVRGFVDKFNKRGIMQVELLAEYDQVKTQDITDSIVACITTAAVQVRDNIYTNWTTKPSFASEAEWAYAKEEGLIVRI